MHELLSTHYGFQDFTILLDTDPSGVQPTGANIKVPQPTQPARTRADLSGALPGVPASTRVPCPCPCLARDSQKALREMVAAAAPGDVLLFHYSGHGVQVPSDAEERDRKDEALCPSDLNVVTGEGAAQHGPQLCRAVAGCPALAHHVTRRLHACVPLPPLGLACFSDDDMRVILSKLPEGAKFFMVADCCHSGTILDQVC